MASGHQDEIAVQWVIERERAAGRKAMDVRGREPYDVQSETRHIEVSPATARPAAPSCGWSRRSDTALSTTRLGIFPCEPVAEQLEIVLPLLLLGQPPLPHMDWMTRWAPNRAY